MDSNNSNVVDQEDVGNTQNQNGGEGMFAPNDIDVEDYLRFTLQYRLVEELAPIPELSSLYSNMDEGGHFPIFLNSTTPQGKAFEWILNFEENGRGLVRKKKKTFFAKSEKPTLVQRYVLAVLFFATEGEYNQNLGSEFTPQGNKVGHWTTRGTLNFLSSVNECSWNNKHMKYGYSSSFRGVIGCDQGTNEVTELVLSGLGLHGRLPEEIGYLSNLAVLDLQNNHLQGELPKSIGRLSKLRSLDISKNKFVGKLPSTLKALTRLEFVDVSFNHMDGESIPSTFCSQQVFGKLSFLSADCSRDVNKVICECCTMCCDPLSSLCTHKIQEDDDIDDFTRI